ncbi:MAG: hypothetical protein GKR94_28445 [Gammaproteobacteria bacterium]|nr:hypothetical protein [Gammaproteobacteria bacterium]
MATLDTDVLVRIRTGDDKVQASAAMLRIRQEATDDTPVLIPLTVTIELEWMLRTRYRFSKPEIINAYMSLLEAKEFEFQDEAAVELALHLFEESTAEFADCLPVGYGATIGRGPLLTFDKKASSRQASRLSDAEFIAIDP